MTFYYKGTPIPKGRPRFMKNGHAYTPQKTRDAERQVAEAYLSQNGTMFPEDIPLKLCCHFYMPIPKNTSKVKRQQMVDGLIRPMKKPDVDNLLKTVLDGLNGVAYTDDKQVVEVKGIKDYAEATPYTYVEVVEVKR